MYCEIRPDVCVYKCRLNFLEAVRIWGARHVYPDEGDPNGNVCHVSPWGAWHVFSGGGVPTSGIFSPKVAALENPHHMVVFQKFWMGKEATVSFIKLIVRPMEINENIFSLFWMATPSLL